MQQPWNPWYKIVSGFKVCAWHTDMTCTIRRTMLVKWPRSQLSNNSQNDKELSHNEPAPHWYRLKKMIENGIIADYNAQISNSPVDYMFSAWQCQYLSNFDIFYYTLALGWLPFWNEPYSGSSYDIVAICLVVFYFFSGKIGTYWFGKS